MHSAGVEEIVAIRRGDDRDVGQAPESIDLGQPAGERLVVVMPDRATADAADRLDLVEEEHHVAVARGLAQLREERPDPPPSAPRTRTRVARLHHREAAAPVAEAPDLDAAMRASSVLPPPGGPTSSTDCRPPSP